jgi:hypothetical protein
MHKLKVSIVIETNKNFFLNKNWSQNTWVTKIFNLKNQKNTISGLSSSGRAYLIRAALRSSVISTQLPMTNDISPLPSDTTRS